MNYLKARLGLVASVILLSISACTSNQPFDRRGWNDGDGIDFPRRNLMVDDLLEKYKFKGMKYKNVVGLLHEPDRFSDDSTSFHYELIRKMNVLDTVKTKNLVFWWNKKDSVISDVKVVEKEYPKKEIKK
ncbi:hypothetical protein ACFQZX_15715 [Mucilaginibacter litoreus]|uniref:Lipoprotein n=1 Tax=Mucilaginibacter litoreus TaxID=1048221 RepID=A0ABW3AW93_9SPHI